MALDKLPFELSQMVAKFLDTDKDICSYRLVCKSTYNAIDGDKLSFWRARFRSKYALRAGISNQHLKEKYQIRRKWLRRGTTVRFHHGHERAEKKTLEALKDLIVESFTGDFGIDDYGRPSCPNQLHLQNFIRDSLYFPTLSRSNTKSQHISAAMAAVQLMCAHYVFKDSSLGHDVFCFEQSQKAVYESAKVAPIFQGFNKMEVNMEWVLHVLNFFSFHIMSDEGSLHPAFRELDDLHKPWPWKRHIGHSAVPLGRYWKGTYAYLDQDEVDDIRSSKADGSTIFVDKNVDNATPFQSLELEFGDARKAPWPKLFERHLQSHPQAQHKRTRAQHRSMTPLAREPQSIRFIGEGDDDPDHFYASGWLNPLPAQPQNCEIPGWHRITFMKHFIDGDDQLGEELWAYEGVVLPGGQMILGRWWWVTEPPSENPYSGPFIFWNVESESPDNDDNLSVSEASAGPVNYAR